MFKKKKKKSYSQKLIELERERTLKRINKDSKKERPVRKKKKKKRKRQLTEWQKKYHDYLQSNEWNDIRIEMLLAYPECQRCGSKIVLQVHHKTYKNIFHEEPEDLEVICKGCHTLEHKK